MPDMSPEELAYLDNIWKHPSYTLKEIKSKMQLKFGVQYEQEQLRDAARRNDRPVTRTPVAIVLAQPKPRVWKPVQIRDTQCKQRVARGTFPVPVGGYKITGRV